MRGKPPDSRRGLGGRERERRKVAASRRVEEPGAERGKIGMVHSASINFLTNRVSQKASFWSEIGKKLDFNSKTPFLRSFSKYGCSLAAKSVKDFLASYVAKMNHAKNPYNTHC